MAATSKKRRRATATATPASNGHDVFDDAISALNVDRHRKKHARQIENYARRRLILIAALGGKCEGCGETDPDKLEFDHKERRTWVASELSRWKRQLQYEKDWEAKVLRLLCVRCNKLAENLPVDPNDEGF